MGFFSSEELSGSPPISLPLCGSCGLYKHCNSPKMPVSGDGRKGILIVGEAPGANEDEQGVQFIGKAGKHFAFQFAACGVDMRRDCWLTNTLICRPAGNAKPTDRQIEYCRPNLLNTIKELNPRIIILSGSAAVKSLIGHIWQRGPGGVSKWVGETIPDQTFNAWICPVWHPSYVKRQHNRALDKIASDQLCMAVGLRGRPWREVPNFADRVEVILDPDRAAKIIRGIVKRGGRASVDYETNMLKPDGPDAKIVTASICWEGKKTISFPWRGSVIGAMIEFLLSGIDKVAANMKFEQRWSMAILRCRPVNWYWDTMEMAHVLDARRGITSLTHQAYACVGQPPWDAQVSPYLKSSDPSLPNRIEECDLQSLLLYGGMDALLEFKLCEAQEKIMRRRLR